MHRNGLFGGPPLFSFFRKGKRIAGATGLTLLPDGIAVARIVWGGSEHSPQLALCEFHEGADSAALLSALADTHGLGQARCHSVMDGSGFTLLLVEAPHVDPTELKAAVRWRIKDLLDFHIDDAVIDVFDIPGQEERGRQKMMYVVAARVSTVQQHIGILEEAGVRLEVIDIPELCQRNVAALLAEDQAGVALLHLGRRNGLLTLTRQGSLYLSRTLDIGTDHLLAELGEPGQPEFDLDYGEERAPLAPGLKRLLDGIVLEVQRSLDYYESHFSLPPVSGMVVAPTGQPIPGMLEHLSGNLGVPVRLLDLNAVLEMETPLSDSLQALCLPAIGAALRREEKAL